MDVQDAIRGEHHAEHVAVGVEPLHDDDHLAILMEPNRYPIP